MTTQNIVSFDPGHVTGVATGSFSETEPLTFNGGTAVTYDVLSGTFDYTFRDPISPFMDEFQHVVSEKFTLRTNNDFAADLSGVRVEGILDVATGGRVVYRERSKKEQVPDSILREHGLWQTGADVGWEDGRDVNDAIIHMLGYVAFDLNHLPTLRKYFR